MPAETRYARTTDGTHVAYQVHGDGPIDLFVQRGWFTNLDHEWDDPILTGIYRRLGSIGRVIRIDRRGSGLSDRLDTTALPTVEDRVDDIRAVLDAVRSERVVLVGLGHASSLFVVFAATYPERTRGLVIWSPPSAVVRRPPDDEVDRFLESLTARWGREDFAAEWVANGAPSRAGDDALVRWLAEDQRLSATPDEAAALARLTFETNVDDVLPAVHVPTLVAWRAGFGDATPRHILERVPAAVACELPGDDMFLMSGDWRRAVAAIEDFVLGLAPAASETERVLATVMFTDMVGSTERAATLGDRAWSSLLERHHAVVRRELATHRGREIDTAGDGFFAAFDGPARAIRAAAGIRDALAPLEIGVKIGLHAGECERAGSALRGVAVHLGARIGASATAGEILVSSTVRDLVAGSGIGFADAGRHRFKGVPEEWQLYRVTSV